MREGACEIGHDKVEGFDNLLEVSTVVSEDREIVDMHVADNNEFMAEAQSKEVVTLKAEIADIKRKLEDRKLKMLHKQNEKLQCELEVVSDMSEDEEVEQR